MSTFPPLRSAPSPRRSWCVTGPLASGLDGVAGLGVSRAVILYEWLLWFPRFDHRGPLDGGSPVVASGLNGPVLDRVLARLRDVLAWRVPDLGFSGHIVLDVEACRPCFARLSADYQRWLAASGVSPEVFDKHAPGFFRTVLAAVRSLRPRATVGWFEFPFPADLAVASGPDCFARAMEGSMAVYPCCYVWRSADPFPAGSTVPLSARVSPSGFRDALLSNYNAAAAFAARLAPPPAAPLPVFPFLWARYHNEGPDVGLRNRLLSDADLGRVLDALPASAAGHLWWEDIGSTADLTEYLGFGPRLAAAYAARYPLGYLDRLLLAAGRYRAPSV